jgi:hypothetical protein
LLASDSASLGLRPSFALAFSIARSIVDLRCGSVEEPPRADEADDFEDEATDEMVKGFPVHGWVDMTSTPNCILSFVVGVLDNCSALSRRQSALV